MQPDFIVRPKPDIPGRNRVACIPCKMKLVLRDESVGTMPWPSFMRRDQSSILEEFLCRENPVATDSLIFNG